MLGHDVLGNFLYSYLSLNLILPERSSAGLSAFSKERRSFFEVGELICLPTAKKGTAPFAVSHRQIPVADADAASRDLCSLTFCLAMIL